MSDAFRNYDAWLEKPFQDRENDCHEAPEPDAVQHAELVKLNARLCSWQRKPATTTAEALFECWPTGQFKMEQEEAGDMHPVEDNDEWWLEASFINLGRKADGNRWVQMGTVDQNGNYDTNTEWDEALEGIAGFTEWLAQDIDNQVSDHFQAWASYWLWCADHGEDPLSEFTKPPQHDEFIDRCIESAQENLDYLFK